MDFYDKFGDILREAIDSGDFLKEKEKATEKLQSELERRRKEAQNSHKTEKQSNTQEKTQVNENDKAKTKTFSFNQFTSESHSKEKSKAKGFDFASFVKGVKEAVANGKKEQEQKEPKVQIYKFTPLVIPQNVLYALNMIGIPQDADFNTAKKIYREKLMYYHPDKWINTQFLAQAQENTQILNNCWEVVEWWFVAR